MKDKTIKNGFWLKLAAVLLIQALFLTQVDFTLAAVDPVRSLLDQVGKQLTQSTLIINSPDVATGNAPPQAAELPMWNFNLFALVLLSFVILNKSIAKRLVMCAVQGSRAPPVFQIILTEKTPNR